MNCANVISHTYNYKANVDGLFSIILRSVVVEISKVVGGLNVDSSVDVVISVDDSIVGDVVNSAVLDSTVNNSVNAVINEILFSVVN